MTTLNDERAATALAALADALIPAGHGRPSAASAGVVPLLQQRIPELLPERVPVLESMVDRIDSDGVEAALAWLRSTDQAGHDVLCETVAGSYFMLPEIRSAIGYPGQVRLLARREASEFESLIAPVLAAGFAPRDVVEKEIG